MNSDLSFVPFVVEIFREKNKYTNICIALLLDDAIFEHGFVVLFEASDKQTKNKKEKRSRTRLIFATFRMPFLSRVNRFSYTRLNKVFH